MNAKTTATIAVAVVALMVFAAAGATTYSWFSDSEEVDITISTAIVDIDASLDGKAVDGKATLESSGIAANWKFYKNGPAMYSIVNNSTIETAVRTYADVIIYDSITESRDLNSEVLNDISENVSIVFGKDVDNLDSFNVVSGRIIIENWFDETKLGWMTDENEVKPTYDRYLNLETTEDFSSQNVSIKVSLVTEIVQIDAPRGTVATGDTEEERNESFKNALSENVTDIIVDLAGDVTYDVAAWANDAMGGNITETITINGNGYTLTYNQTNSDWNNIVTVNGAKLILNNLHITNSGYNNGPWNRHDLNFACDVEMNNVTSDKAFAFKADATLKNVTINDPNTSDTYAIWIQPRGQTVLLDGCTIDMIDCTDGRGIKIDNQYLSSADEAKVTLNVKDTIFKTEEKSAILVKSTAGAVINLDGVNILDVAADPINAVWVDEASKSYADLVEVTGGNKIVEGDIEYDLVIKSLEEFKDFRDAVNNGTTYDGDKVGLAVDIDLKNESWTPIGLNADSNAKFYGIFDGGNHTISNLLVSTNTGYTAAGLFGALNGHVKNLNIIGAEISHISSAPDGGTDNGIAVVAGSIYTCGSIDNVHVKDVTVTGNRYIGGIAGYVYGSITNCSVENAKLIATPDKLTGSYDNGDKVGGIVGYWCSENTYRISGNKSTSVTITGYRDMGGIIGAGDKINGMNVNDNIVKDLTIIIDRTNFYEDKPYNANAIVGRIVSGTLGSDNKSEGCSIAVKDLFVDASNVADVIKSGVTDITLSGGSYLLTGDMVGGKTLTINARDGENVIIATGAGNGSYIGLNGANITFNGVTISGQTSGQYNGFAHAGTMIYNNCTFKGTVTIYSNSVFNKCTFNLPKGCYVWTAWGASEVTYTGCTFNTEGKALLIYHENGNSTVNVTGCVFNATAGDKAGAIANQDCAAIEIDNSGKGVGTNTACKFTLNTSNNTIDSDFSGEWRIKTFDGTGSVTVNGTSYDSLALDGKKMDIDSDKNVTVE